MSRNSRACCGSQDDAAGVRQHKNSETAWNEVRSIGTISVLGLVDPGHSQRDLPAMIGYYIMQFCKSSDLDNLAILM